MTYESPNLGDPYGRCPHGYASYTVCPKCQIEKGRILREQQNTEVFDRLEERLGDVPSRSEA